MPGVVDAVQDKPVDGPLAKVFGDFRAGVVGAKGLLVDVLLKDVAEDIRVDFVVLAAGRVVEVPGIALKQGKEVFESLVRDVDLRPPLLHRMEKEQAAVEVLDLSQEGLAGADRQLRPSRFGKTLEEQDLQELLIIEIAVLSSAFRRACSAGSVHRRCRERIFVAGSK